MQGALAAGLLGGGSRFLGVTEDTGRFLHDVAPRVDCREDDAGWDALALETVRAQRAPGSSCPASATTSTRTATRAPPVSCRSPRRRAASARTCSSSPRSGGCTREVLGPHPAAERGGGLRGRAGRPRPAAAAAARLRAARPHRGPDRPARRGAAPSDGERHLPGGRPGRGPGRARTLEVVMTLPLLPTSLVGSYAQPEWLIDRAKLAGRFPPRVRAKELWRVRARAARAGPGRRHRAGDPGPGARRAGHRSPTARSAARATPTTSPPRSTASTSTTRAPRSTAAGTPTRCRASSGRSTGRTRSQVARPASSCGATPTVR